MLPPGPSLGRRTSRGRACGPGQPSWRWVRSGARLLLGPVVRGVPERAEACRLQQPEPPRASKCVLGSVVLASHLRGPGPEKKSTNSSDAWPDLVSWGSRDQAVSLADFPDYTSSI